MIRGLSIEIRCDENRLQAASVQLTGWPGSQAVGESGQGCRGRGREEDGFGFLRGLCNDRDRVRESGPAYETFGVRLQYHFD
jgi:hypothetical protein